MVGDSNYGYGIVVVVLRVNELVMVTVDAVVVIKRLMIVTIDMVLRLKC